MATVPGDEGASNRPLLCRSPPVKHDHKLKALAIKKGQTHVVGSPSLSFEGTPVFMDVEGMPDRDFYYLIGLRYEMHGSASRKDHSGPTDRKTKATSGGNACAS